MCVVDLGIQVADERRKRRAPWHLPVFAVFIISAVSDSAAFVTPPDVATTAVTVADDRIIHE
jgi:hypothetical protein